MAAQTGFVKPKNLIVIRGTPHKVEKFVKTATNVYPGRLVTKDTTDAQIKVCGATGIPLGWAGYESTCIPARNNSVDDIYEAGDAIAVEFGGDVVRVATLTTSQTVVAGDRLVQAADGCLQKASALSVATGAVDVTSSAANGAIVSGDVGALQVVAIALEAVTTTTATAKIVVASLL